MPNPEKKKPSMATATKTIERVLTVEFDREDDGRWIAEVLELPGVMVYGASQEDAYEKVRKLALQVIADSTELSEVPTSLKFSVA